MKKLKSKLKKAMKKRGFRIYLYTDLGTLVGILYAFTLLFKDQNLFFVFFYVLLFLIVNAFIFIKVFNE